MKKKLLRKETINNREVLVFANVIKPRLPIAPPGFAHTTKKQRIRNKRIKVTQFNWDKI
jgi:hypothetical protein